MAGVKWSDDAYFTPGGDCQEGDVVMGLRSGGNYKFTFPGTGIQDGNGNFLVSWTSLGISATDYLQITNGETGTSPAISALGTDTNVGMNLVSQGTGQVGVTGLFNINGSTAINSIIDDDTFATATAQNVPTAESVKAYVDAHTGGIFTWVTVAGTSQLVSHNMGYIPLNGSLTTFTLPATCPIGFTFSIEGLGNGGWMIQAGGGQYIRLLSTLSSAGGTCSSARQYDNCSVVVVTADVEFKLMSGGSSGLILA
jgi:hypothetical protein